MKIVISPKERWDVLDIRDWFRFRDLFYFLAWRDIKVRYKQTAIGILWAFIVPFVTMVVFTIFFGNLVSIREGGVPYPLFVFVGLLFWTFFSQAITNASNSLVASQDIIKKIYFPKIFLPASSVVVALIDFVIAAIFLVGMMIYYRTLPEGISLLILPLAILLTILSSFGIGLLLAAVNVKFRDVRYIVPFMMQILLFVTPVIYPSTILGERFQWVLYVNPLAGVIETARAVLLGLPLPNTQSMMMTVVMSIVLFVVGIIYFRKTERYFADII